MSDSEPSNSLVAPATSDLQIPSRKESQDNLFRNVVRTGPTFHPRRSTQTQKRNSRRTTSELPSSTNDSELNDLTRTARASTSGDTASLAPLLPSSSSAATSIASSNTPIAITADDDDDWDLLATHRGSILPDTDAIEHVRAASFSGHSNVNQRTMSGVGGVTAMLLNGKIPVLSNPDDPEYMPVSQLVDYTVSAHGTSLELRNAALLLLHYFTTPPLVLRRLIRLLLRPPPRAVLSPSPSASPAVPIGIPSSSSSSSSSDASTEEAITGSKPTPFSPPSSSANESYNAPSPASSSSSASAASTAASTSSSDRHLESWRVHKLRVLGALHYWIRTYPQDFDASMRRDLVHILTHFPPPSWTHLVADQPHLIKGLPKVCSMVLRSLERSARMSMSVSASSSSLSPSSSFSLAPSSTGSSLPTSASFSFGSASKPSSSALDAPSPSSAPSSPSSSSSSLREASNKGSDSNGDSGSGDVGSGVSPDDLLTQHKNNQQEELELLLPGYQGPHERLLRNLLTPKLRKLLPSNKHQLYDEFLKRSPKDLAAQLTLLAMDRVLHIGSARDFLSLNKAGHARQGQGQGQGQGPAPINQMKISNQMSCWIASSVLECESVSAQQKMVRLWVGVAHECWQLHNFCTLFEIIYGINHNSVFRLHGGFGKAGGLFRALPEPLRSAYQSMCKLTSPLDNYAVYRTAMAEAQH